MAIIALQQSVRADQRKTVLMIAYGLDRDLPSLDRVATLAVSSELTVMNVGMAIGTLGAHVLKDQTGVALHTANLLVHAAQRVACQIVIEFGIGTDGPPACIGVAFLARDGERSMRIRHFGSRAVCVIRTRVWLGLLGSNSCHYDQRHEPRDD